jgi:hypothetical protein
LPSWCANFNLPATAAGLLDLENPETNYCAGIQAENNGKLPVITSIEAGRISIRGFYVDKVVKVIPPCWPRHEGRAVYKWERTTANQALNWKLSCLMLSPETCRLLDSLPEAHWRTIVENRISTEDGFCARQYMVARRYLAMKSMKLLYGSTALNLMSVPEWFPDKGSKFETATAVKSLETIGKVCAGRSFFQRNGEGMDWAHHRVLCVGLTGSICSKYKKDKLEKQKGIRGFSLQIQVRELSCYKNESILGTSVQFRIQPDIIP